MDDAAAKKLLDYLLESQPGVLKVITSEPDSKAKTGDPRNPAYNVLHVVTRIEPHPARAGHLVAYTDEGDYVESYGGAHALLVRLTEWNHFSSREAGVANAARNRAEAALDATYNTLHGIGAL